MSIQEIAPQGDGNDLKKVANLLGGARILSRRLTSGLDAHELIMHGLPAAALDHLVGRLVVISKPDAIEKAVGMSVRTYQRGKEAPSRLLSREQSGRTWKFGEILSRATDLLGSQAEAERWLERPAIGLNQRRPIDLLATPAGVELVEHHLLRLEYGVYA